MMRPLRSVSYYSTRHLKLCSTIRPTTSYRRLLSPHISTSSLQPSTPSSTSSLHPSTLLKRTVDYFNSYPFVKYSLLLCGVVLGGSLAFESYTKHKKKQLPQILSLPPRPAHITQPRPTELQRLKEKRKEARKRGEGVVYLVGPAGSGKTELVSQYGLWFIQQSLNFTYRFRIKKPTVLYLNGGSDDQLLQSLREAALCLGLKEIQEENEEEGEMTSLARAVQRELASSKVPWLIITDNLTPNTTPTFQSIFHSGDLEWNWEAGHVVVTSRHPPAHSAPVITISDRMEEETALALMKSLSPSIDFTSVDNDKLSPLLSSSPLVLALAASTVSLYSASLAGSEGTTSSGLQEYLEILSENGPTTPEKMAEVCVRLYVEAAATDLRVGHSFDLMASLSPTHPLPVLLLDHHLSSSFYRLPSLEPPPSLTSQPVQDTSLWAQLKMMVPFGKKSPPPPSPSSLTGVDRLHHLRNSPLLSFRKFSREGFELVELHPQTREEVSQQFLTRTVPQLEKIHLQEAKEVFRTTAWFKNYRKFDESAALIQYRSSLPGVSGAGVLTREAFLLSPLAQRGTYSQYLHTISHYHLISSSIISLLKLADDGFAATQFSHYVQPHLTHLLNLQNHCLSDNDLVMCRYGLAAILSISSPDSAHNIYQLVLEEQKRLFGDRHPAVARTLTDMAGLSFTSEELDKARNLLEEAIKIYSSLSSKSLDSEIKIDHGLALSSLAVVSSCQGEKRKSRDLLEQALNLYQSMPESGEVSVYQRRLVASTLTDLSQAYLSLGQIVLAQKYVELAMLAMPNVYPEGSPETVRTLTVAGAVYALLGDKRESQRVGQEAGKEKAKLEKQQILFM